MSIVLIEGDPHALEVSTTGEACNSSVGDRLGELMRFVHPDLDSPRLPVGLSGAELQEQFVGHQLLVLSTQGMLNEVTVPGS